MKIIPQILHKLFHKFSGKFIPVYQKKEKFWESSALKFVYVWHWFCSSCFTASIYSILWFQKEKQKEKSLGNFSVILLNKLNCIFEHEEVGGDVSEYWSQWNSLNGSEIGFHQVLLLFIPLKECWSVHKNNEDSFFFFPFPSPPFFLSTVGKYFQMGYLRNTL